MLDTTQDTTTAVTDAELAALEQELAEHDAPSDPNPTNTTVDATLNGPEADSNRRPEAILLQGVDEMKTRDIRVYCQDLPLDKIEWINDTSCMYDG